MFKLIVIDLRFSYFQVSLEVEWVRMFCHLRILIFKHLCCTWRWWTLAIVFLYIWWLWNVCFIHKLVSCVL